ncbi:MAG: SpoIID/LytB domain-containing protein [Bryobacteraceae bacterium]
MIPVLLAAVTLQSAVDRAFVQVSGAAVVLEIGSGRTLAVHNAALARNARVTPGSAIKPFVLAGLLAASSPLVKRTLTCPGPLAIGSRRLDCSHGALPGALGAREAIAFSCNNYFADLAARAPPGAIADALARYGFDISRDADPRRLALGDDGVAVSPLDFARAYARLASTAADTRYAPLWNGLIDAVEVGTGQLATVPGLSIAGKTGTTATHAWFAALAPAAKPEVVVVVFTRHGRGGGTAAPIAGRILGAWASEGVEGAAINVQNRRVPIEEYVAGVLAGEASQVSEAEALKAFAVTVRTFARVNHARHTADGFDVCAGTHCQRFRPRDVTDRQRAAAEATEGETIWFEGRQADVFFHQHCGGTTEAAHEVWPELRRQYLTSRDDTFCVARGRPSWRASIDARHFAIVARSPSGRVKQVRWNGRTLTFDEFQAATASRVRSAIFEANCGGGRCQLTGRGAGHGVGLCQAGAVERARAGHGYRRILDAYFPGTKTGITAQGISWTRRSGERVEMWTLDASRDASMLASAEQALRAAESRFGHRLAARPVLRIYPDTAMFRDATGEPGWVLASAVGRTIRLRRDGAPALLHEFLHLLVEEQNRATLPDWFREGLVLYLENPSAAPSTAASVDGIRAPANEAAMRAAYRAAHARVSALVSRHGRETVLSWLPRGLPGDLARRHE